MNTMYEQYINNPQSTHEWRMHHLDNFLRKRANITGSGPVYAHITIAYILYNAREHYIRAFEQIIKRDVLSQYNNSTYLFT